MTTPKKTKPHLQHNQLQQNNHLTHPPQILHTQLINTPQNQIHKLNQIPQQPTIPLQHNTPKKPTIHQNHPNTTQLSKKHIQKLNHKTQSQTIHKSYQHHINTPNLPTHTT